MKPMRLVVLLGGVAMAAACVPQREAPPPPQPRPLPPRPVPPPPPPPPADWRDIPLTPGGWVYRGDGSSSEAQFGAGSPAFTIRCDRGQDRITLMRAGSTSGSVMTVRTSFGARNFPVAAGRQPIAAAVPASDRFLDSMAFSRGRFTVEAAGLPMLVIPSWPEPARVIEDCRG